MGDRRDDKRLREKEKKLKHKQRVLLILALFLFLTGEAMAASNPPAKVCAQLVSISDPGNLLRMVLVVKSAGSVRMANGPTTSYAVNGFAFAQPGGDIWNYPIVGEGFMDKEEGRFNFSVFGSTLFSGVFFSVSMFGFWDIADKSGIVYADLSGTVGGTTSDNAVTFLMTELACTALELPEPPTGL